MTAEPTLVVPREVVCVIDHLHRDVSIANDACAGRYTHGGVRLGLGCRPDWLRDGLADDEEWRIEWVKLYEGLDLAHGYAVTGDQRMLETWQSLVVSFCEQVPVGYDSSDVSARRIQNWLYAWQRFTAAGARLDATSTETVASRLRADAMHLRNHLTAERNHRTLELYALLLAALALPDSIDPDESIRDFAITEIGLNAATDIWSDGTHRECSTDYHHIVLRSLLGVIANARRFDLELPSGYLDRVSLACDFALHVQRPDGTIPSFSDGDNGDFRDVLALGADLLNRGDLAWAASGGMRGRAPTARSVTFPVSGYVVQRSGWGDGADAYDEERFALFDCGPLGDGGHGHYDQLHVELVDGRRVLAVDPGRYTYADNHWRHWFKGTAGHNTVTVDGLDQTKYRRGKPKGAQSIATLIERSTCDRLDLVVGQVVSPEYDAVHTRRLAFVDNRYWVIHDVLRSPTTHRYTLRWHLAADVHPRVVCNGGWTTIATDDAQFVIAGAKRVRLEEGWISQSYGQRQSALSISAELSATSADLLTVVIPSRSGGASSAWSVTARDGACTVGLTQVGTSGEPFEMFRWPATRTSGRESTELDDVVASWHRFDGDGAATARLLFPKPTSAASVRPSSWVEVG